ncbi:hypothetical protein BDW66DRAFT_168425 [Aspergillus desertorum]
MARQWVLTGQEGFETSLEYQQGLIIPSVHDLGLNDILVKMHAASLNYRELVIAGPMGINGPITPPIIPGCDGAGLVEAVGPSVAHGDDAHAGVEDAIACLGQGSDGTLRSWAVFPEAGLVRAPRTLDWLSAATLSCTWLTAWNALFGLKSKPAGRGSWVLVQGTGGVSIAALQLAVAAGATVVATTSTVERAGRLKALGAVHVVNYRNNQENWGKEAGGLTPDGRGFDFVVDIGGNETFPHTLAAIRVDGVVLVVGQVGDSTAEPVPVFAALMHSCIIRGILGGTRNQFRELVRFIDEKKIVPAIDDLIFELAEAKDAYRRLKEKKHFAKVVIRVDHLA